MIRKFSCMYAVIRFVPDPIRNEPRNIGIILQCQSQRYVGIKFVPDWDHLHLRASDRLVLCLYQGWADQVNKASKSGDTVFLARELSPDFLSTLPNNNLNAIQFSEPCGCITHDPEQTLNELYTMLVAPKVDLP